MQASTSVWPFGEVGCAGQEALEGGSCDQVSGYFGSLRGCGVHTVGSGGVAWDRGAGRFDAGGFACKDDGEAGLLDRRLGKASGRRVPVDRESEVEALYRMRYSGFTAKHFHEQLVRRRDFPWSYSWTKTNPRVGRGKGTRLTALPTGTEPEGADI